MTYDPTLPAYRLHTLVSALDAAADAMLREAHGTSYARFLTLVTVQALGTPTQAELAAAQGVSAPAASRMVQTLVEAGLVEAVRTAGAGNRRALVLTPAGEDLLAQGGALLEDAFGRLLDAADVTAAEVRRVTDPLLALLRPEAP
ncbi:MAG: MarR family winged helix-turn-helix transcriptional regulator [Aeromicrobium erythreum]